jgi:putative ABC transport system permease protein
MLGKLAWRNLWRNRNRSLITMASVFFAVILSTLIASLQAGVFDHLIKNVVSFYSGYIQVHAKGYWDERTLENTFESSFDLITHIKKQKGITEVAGRLESFALVSGDSLTKGCAVIGIEPEVDDKIIQLESKIINGNYLNGNDDTSVLIPLGLAKRLDLGVNDTILILGQGYQSTTAAGKFLIKGILKFGSPELNDGMLFMALNQAQNLYSAEKRLTSLVIGIINPNELEKIRATLKNTLDSSYEVLTWGEMMPDIKQHIESDSKGKYIYSGVLYMLVAFGIFGTLLMMLAERKFEFGMLLAIGMKKRELNLVVLMEAILVCFVGCATGILVSYIIALYLKVKPIKLTGSVANIYEKFGFEAVFPASTKWSIFIQEGLIVLVIALILSLYPLFKIYKLNAVEAMRK